MHSPCHPSVNVYPQLSCLVESPHCQLKKVLQAWLGLRNFTSETHRGGSAKNYSIFLFFYKHLLPYKGQSDFISFWYRSWIWFSTFQWDEKWKFLQDYQLDWVWWNSTCRGWNQVFLVLCSSGGAELLSLAHGVIVLMTVGRVRVSWICKRAFKSQDEISLLS